jgi:hypothetical protein
VGPGLGLKMPEPLCFWALVALLFDVAGRDSPRRATSFLARARKEAKNTPPSLRPLRGKPVAGCLRGVPQNSLRAGALRSNNRGELDNEACALRRACHPASTPPQAQPQGEQPYGPSLRSAWPCAARSACAVRGRAQRWPVLPGSLLAVPRSAAHGVGMGVEAPMLRGLTCRGCSNGAPLARSEFHGTPHARAPQVARSEAKGHGQQGRLSLAYLSLTKQRKVGAPPGAHPGQRHENTRQGHGREGGKA